MWFEYVTHLTSVVLFMAITLPYSISISMIELPNHCKANDKQPYSSNTATLVSSVIAQMQTSVDGSLSCTCIIADDTNDQLVYGNNYLD